MKDEWRSWAWTVYIMTFDVLGFLHNQLKSLHLSKAKAVSYRTQFIVHQKAALQCLINHAANTQRQEYTTG